MLTSLKSCRSRDTVAMLQRERRQEFIPPIQRYGHSIRQIWIRWTTQHQGYPSREGLPFADPWCEGVERTSAEGVEAAGHTILTAAIARWYSHLNACIRVDGGHFEHKFWASDFLLCFVCFIDTGSPKCDWYKHVQSANTCIVWNVCVCDFHMVW